MPLLWAVWPVNRLARLGEQAQFRLVAVSFLLGAGEILRQLLQLQEPLCLVGGRGGGSAHVHET